VKNNTTSLSVGSDGPGRNTNVNQMQQFLNFLNKAEVFIHICFHYHFSDPTFYRKYSRKNLGSLARKLYKKQKSNCQ